MENPQAQMPQGQPGPSQGQAPQQGGQDPQMQQLMQAVQQMIQQGAQPVDVAAELLGKQVPPEMIMQVFVQMGLPEQEAQSAIEQAMQGGQQQQGPGEEQMEGAASNPQEEQAEQQGAPAMPPGMEGQPPMAFGGQPRRQLRRFANGAAVDPNQELQTVIAQVQEMMQNGSDAKQVMQQIQAAAQQGQISPEVATQVLEQLSGMQQASNPQGDDATMTAQSQDPQAMDPNMAAPDQQMARFGGNLKQLLKKAYGGNAVPPSLDSKDYVKDRANMFVNSVKNNAFKSTLDDEFPSLSGNQMAYGGMPKAGNGIEMKDGKLVIDPTQYKSESDYKAAIYDWNSNAANKDNQVTNDLFTANKWTEQPDQNASYKYDPNTKQYVKQEAPKNTNQFQYQEGDVINYDNQGAYITRKDGSMQRVPGGQMPGSAYNVSQSTLNPVDYGNPFGGGLFGNAYAGASPFARFLATSGYQNNPRITGANLPGGLNAEQFLGATGPNGLVPGMTGKIGDQTWRVGEAEKFKEGSIWKGNRRKGVRYTIDWGDANAMNGKPANAPTGSTYGPGYDGYNADSNGDGIPDYLSTGNTTPGATLTNNQPAINLNPAGPSADPNLALGNQGNAVPGMTSDGSNMTWNSGNMPTLQNPMNGSTANGNQNLVTPGQSDVQQPAAEVNPQDNSQANMMVTNVTDQGIRGIQDGKLVSQDYATDKRDRWDRQADRQARREERRGANEPAAPVISNTAPGAGPDPNLALGNRGPEVTGVTPNSFWNSNPGEKPWENAPVPAPTKQELRQDKRQLNREFRQGRRAVKNILNEGAAETNPMPEVMQQAFQQQAYGGGVHPADLQHAINLINRAFGGMMPVAENGMNMQSPFANQGQIEATNQKKLNINWDAAADMYANGAPKLTKFMNDVRSYRGDLERDNAKFSALNRRSDTYDTMNRGVYDQWGNFDMAKVGNEVLNPTDTYYNNQSPQIFAYGGRLYEIGGDVDLDDHEVEQLAAAGFKLSRV